MHDLLTQLDCGKCNAPAPYYSYKDGKLVCQGAGDSHLPRSMRARSPHGLFPPSAVPPLTDEERSSESRRAQSITSEIPPELSNLMNQVLATERVGPLRRGDFVLRTTNLRSWIAADATHLHHTSFIKTANLVCRGAGDSHLPQSMRARSPHGLFSPSAVPPLTDEERSSESRRAQSITSGIPPELSNLIDQVLATERFGPLRRGISCYARPACAAGLRQMRGTCTMISKKIRQTCLPGCR